MPIDRVLIRQIRALDQYDLRRLQIFIRGLLVDGEHPGGPDGGDAPGKTVTFRQEHVKCGKPGCRTCPHGPYWYAYWREKGRVRSRYIGRHLPGHSEGSQAGPDYGPAAELVWHSSAPASPIAAASSASLRPR